jgi:hypothetical protein
MAEHYNYRFTKKIFNYWVSDECRYTMEILLTAHTLLIILEPDFWFSILPYPTPQTYHQSILLNFFMFIFQLLSKIFYLKFETPVTTTSFSDQIMELHILNTYAETQQPQAAIDV